MKEAADYLGISYWLINQLAKRKQIPCSKVGGKYLFRVKALDEYLTQKEEASVQQEGGKKMVQVQWLKVYTDIFDNEKMKKLLRNRDGDTYFRVWIQLLTLAAKSNQHGAILLGENIPMSKEDLAKVMHKTLNKLEKIIQDLHKLDMIIVEKDTICIKNWDMYQSADELEKLRESNRRRQQKYRDKQKDSNVIVTSSNTEDKNREEKNKNRQDISNLENESGFKE